MVKATEPVIKKTLDAEKEVDAFVDAMHDKAEKLTVEATNFNIKAFGLNMQCRFQNQRMPSDTSTPIRI